MFKMLRKENKTRQTNKQKRLNKSEMALEEKKIFQMICTVKINKTVQQYVHDTKSSGALESKIRGFLKNQNKTPIFFYIKGFEF